MSTRPRIKVHCPICGDVSVPPDRCEGRSLDGQPCQLDFTCPDCQDLVTLDVSNDMLIRLSQRGVPVVVAVLSLTATPMTDVEVDDIAAQLAYATDEQILEEAGR